MTNEHDVVVVGASLAGCTAAVALARRGARVAVVDQRPDPQAFKRVCGHFIQAGAVPTLERLGFLEPMLAAGAVRSRGLLHTPFGFVGGAKLRSVNLRRERLDPLIRSIAAAEPGVEMLLGLRVDGLVGEGDEVRGVRAVDTAGERVELRARLVVGADGRDSRVAKLARVEERRSPHARISYGAYYEGALPDGAPDGTVWILDPDWAAAFPTDDGLVLYAAMPTKERLPAFKADPTRALREFIAGLPDAPPILEGRQVGETIGKIDLTNVQRGPVAPGLALVGDAALATDPLWGVGCGWAFQTGEWLADAVGRALAGEEPLAKGLRRYARRHRRELGPHVRMIHGYANGRRLDPAERLLYWAGARDGRVAELMDLVGTRSMKPMPMVARALPRALALRARHRLGLGGRAPRAGASAVAAAPRTTS